MRSFRVLSAVFDQANNRIEVVKEITEDDGSTGLNLHTFHPETLEWKAAEYDIDDMDELIDVVLHEPFIEDVRPLELTAAEAKQLCRSRVADAKVRLSSGKNGDKTEHKSRLRLAGVDDKYVTSADEDPLAVIRRCCTYDSEVVIVKKEFIAQVRQSLAEERLQREQVHKQTGSERAAALRKGLGMTQQPRKVKSRGVLTAKAPKLDTIELHGKRK